MTDRLVWLDGEMTGLDTEIAMPMLPWAVSLKGQIVELAVVVTDTDLNPVHSGFNVVVHQPEGVLAQSSDFARTRHAASGLYDLVRSEGVDRREAQKQVVSYLGSHGVKRDQSPLCGNSIWTDRMFLYLQMPHISAFLSHQMIDVTSLKLLAKYWHPEIFTARPKKANGHRALDDILESIEELRYYRTTLFR